MAGFQENNKLRKGIETYTEIQNRGQRLFNQMQSLHQKMKNLRFSIDRWSETNGGPFTQDHINELEELYDLYKSEVQALLNDTTNDLAMGGRDIIAPNEEPQN